MPGSSYITSAMSFASSRISSVIFSIGVETRITQTFVGEFENFAQCHASLRTQCLGESRERRRSEKGS